MKEHRQFYPRPGWVEHDPEEIWANVLSAIRETLQGGEAKPNEISALGITNQRETVVFWDRDSGKPLCRAIVWQCRRTADMCRALKEEGHEDKVRNKTGLLIDPYFTGTKIRWALDNQEAVAGAMERGSLACGTIDSYLLYRLTGGRVFATDFSNASRTLLFNIHDCRWDHELLDLFRVPESVLPAVKPSSYIYGETDQKILNGYSVPVSGIAGDQQSALFGQGCFSPGMSKNTYGTGSFLLMNTGEKAVLSENGLLTTIAWNVANKVEYALEGSIFITGAAIQWLRDSLGIIKESSELESLALTVENSGGVYFVPAFVGLGAPHWDPYARGLIIGLTGAVNRGHLARSVVEAMAFQTGDVLKLMHKESELPVTELRVDGGASVMDLLLQFQADITGVAVRRSSTYDTTALGAAYLAGLAVNYWESPGEISSGLRQGRLFEPEMNDKTRKALCKGWKKAVNRSLGWVE